MNIKKISILLLTVLSFMACKNETKDKSENTLNKGETSKEISEEALLDTVQKQTLKYFWDYAEPNSGMARERFHPDGDYPKNDSHVVTTGGSGFGLMGIVAGIERGFIPRDSAVARL
ncbi:MAG: beta-glucosidase, partial [Christiangramia sp.]|nr:beta-glucosidase [Christiangramia sp.]